MLETPENSSTFSSIEKGSEKIFTNHLILSEIFSWLPLQDKKSLLRVNHLCHSTLIDKFRGQTLVVFKTPKDVQSFTKYFSKYDFLPITEFRFEASLNLTALARDPHEPESRRERRFRRKRNSQLEAVVLEKFFERFSSQIKILSGTFIWGSKKQLDKLLQLFKMLRNAQELTFRPVKMNGRYVSIPPRGSVELPTVRKMVMYHESVVPWNTAWEFILQAFPCVEYLGFPSMDPNGPIHHNQIRHSNMIINALTDPRDDNPWRRSSLKGLSLLITEPFNFYKLSTLTTTFEHLDLLNGVPWTGDVNRSINCVLEHHAVSLKYLKLPINIGKRKENLERDRHKNYILPLNFPKLPELKELIVEFILEKVQNEPSRFKLLFPYTEIQYWRMFPKLETLHIQISSNSTDYICGPWMENINNTFIPPNYNTSPSAIPLSSLRRLKIPNHFQFINQTEFNEQKNKAEDIMKNFLNRISKMFPNVKTPIFTSHCQQQEDEIMTRTKHIGKD